MYLYRFFAKASKRNDLSGPSGPLSALIMIKEASDAARKCERYQLRMRAISSSKHMKLKSTIIYSKGVLVNHTKISTNEIQNFPLYGTSLSWYKYFS